MVTMGKKLLVVLLATAVCLSIGRLGITAEMGEAAKGIVTKVEGGQVTIRDAMGEERTVAPKNPEALNDVNVGDPVAIKDGMLMKEGGSGSSAPSPGRRY